MKTYAITILLILSVFQVTAQHEPPPKFMLQSKFKGMYLRMNDDKHPIASSFYYGMSFFIERGELTRAYDPSAESPHFLQIKDGEIILDTYDEPELTDEEARQRLVDIRLGEKVEVLEHKSGWYFEPCEEEGYVYIVTPYDPYPGYCLTINNEIKNGDYEVILAPKRKSLNDDQKWRLIIMPN